MASNSMWPYINCVHPFNFCATQPLNVFAIPVLATLSEAALQKRSPRIYLALADTATELLILNLTSS
jgi:hypothetical protein